MIDEAFLDSVLDSEVDCVRFRQSEMGELSVSIHYTDGTENVMWYDGTRWRLTSGSPPYDAATATGMYDR